MDDDLVAITRVCDGVAEMEEAAYHVRREARARRPGGRSVV
jgi:hypothetical protein